MVWPLAPSLPPSCERFRGLLVPLLTPVKRYPCFCYDTVYVSIRQHQLYTIHVEINELFSINLARLRKAKGLSQRDLASKTGLTQRMINHYEHNPRSLPVDRLKLLASALGSQVSDFFNENESAQVDSLDVRWVKKIQELQNLSDADRKEINQHINSLIEKARLKKESEPTTR